MARLQAWPLAKDPHSSLLSGDSVVITRLAGLSSRQANGSASPSSLHSAATLCRSYSNPLVNVNVNATPHDEQARVGGRELDKDLGSSPLTKVLQTMAVDRHVCEPKAESAGPASPRSRPAQRCLFRAL